VNGKRKTTGSAGDYPIRHHPVYPGDPGIFLTMITYHAVGAVMTVRAECPGLSTVLSYVFLQPLRAAH
jgi:hypothetical protein